MARPLNPPRPMRPAPTAGSRLPLAVKLACRNLMQDRLRFAATVIGIVVSIVLVTIQLGLYLSFERMVSTMIDHADADLWIVPYGTKCFEDPSLLDASLAARATAVSGVAAVTPLLIGFAPWSVPSGGSTPVLAVGADFTVPGLKPWHLVQGDLAALAAPHAVAIDRTYVGRLGTQDLGAETEIRGQPVKIAAVTEGIRSFTTTPYVFANLAEAARLTGTPAGKISYLLVRLAPGADAAAVSQNLAARLGRVEVLTSQAFSTRSRDFWLFGTGAGGALFVGAILGAVVGIIVVAQTLYSSTKDHFAEFATLRAIGSSGWYIHKVIICQALAAGVIGFALATGLCLAAVEASARSALPVLMTPKLTAAIFLLSLLMCVLSATAAIVQVMRIEPARVFKL